MSSHELQQLFERFFRASNKDTREVGGTGLGLSITKSLVEMHGGSISVTSEVQKGSTFTIAFPISVKRGDRVVRAADNTAGARILIIDDEPDIAHLLRRYLERGGFEVTIAASGQEGFQRAVQVKPDLIVLDVMLPDARGFTVLEWLKADSITFDIPVIFLSISADNGEGKRLGAVDYLLKPIQEQVLLERARSVIAESRLTRASLDMVIPGNSPLTDKSLSR